MASCGTVFVPFQQAENSWIFSTIFTPVTNNPAVGSNRQFGFTDNGDSTYTIFTRCADVATGLLDHFASDRVFSGAEACWNSLFDGIIEFVNSHAGSAGNKEVLVGQYPIEK